MSEPKRKAYVDGTIAYKVRFRLNGTSSSTTFKGPPEYEADTKRAAAAFAGMVKAVGPAEALEWQRRNDADEVERRDLPTMNEWAEDYIATRTKASDGTRHGYRRDWANLFGPLIGDIPLDQLDRREISKAINWLVTKGGRDGTGYSDKSMKNAFGFLNAALNLAVHDRLIPANPCATVELPERTGHKTVEMYLFSQEEYDALISAIRPHYRPLVEALAGTGMRWGEAEALQVGDVLLDNAPRLLVTKAAKWDTSKAQRVVGPTKTKNGKRTITLPNETAAALEPLLRNRPKRARLFDAPKGGPLRHKSFWMDAWRPAMHDLGLTDPWPRPHDLRHSHASWLIAQGVPLPVIQKRLGHHSITVTVDIYGHLSPDIQRAAADAASMFFSGRQAQIEA